MSEELTSGQPLEYAMYLVLWLYKQHWEREHGCSDTCSSWNSSAFKFLLQEVIGCFMQSCHVQYAHVIYKSAMVVYLTYDYTESKLNMPSLEVRARGLMSSLASVKRVKQPLSLYCTTHKILRMHFLGRHTDIQTSLPPSHNHKLPLQGPP